MQVGIGPFNSQYFPLESQQGVPQGLIHLVSDPFICIPGKG